MQYDRGERPNERADGAAAVVVAAHVSCPGEERLDVASLDPGDRGISRNPSLRNSPKIAKAEVSLEIVLGRSTAERASR